jgi:hypothetical protein
MGRKELSTLATRAKSAGNNKHDVTKERKKERKKTKIAWEERSLVH